MTHIPLLGIERLVSRELHGVTADFLLVVDDSAPAFDAVGNDAPVDFVSLPTFVEGRSVGRGGALSLPGGPLAAVAFELGRCARRGLPMKAGYVISTGAATGIHDIRAGESARVKFDGVAELLCQAIPAMKGVRT